MPLNFEVDKMIDEGKLGGDDRSNQESKPQKVIKGDITQIENKKGVYVWIAPYSDDDATTHGAQKSFVPIKPNPEGVE